MKNAHLMRIAVLVLAPLFAGNLAAQTTPSCTRFLAATEWTGTFTLTGTGSGTTPAGDSYSVNESITATPDLTSAVGGPAWKGTFNETIHIDDTFIASDGFLVSHITDDEMLTNGVISALAKTLPALGVNTVTCSFEFDWDPSNDEVSTDGNGAFVVGGGTGFIGGYPVGSFVVSAASIAGPLPASGTTILASVSLSAPSQIGVPVTWTMNLSLTPKQDLDLIITIPGYSTWRPTAGHLEKDTGLDALGHYNLLEIQALLVNKTTQQPVDFPPDKVTFQLVEISHEPGVAMNWPQQGSATSDPDMTFDLDQNPECNGAAETCTFRDPVTLEIVSPFPPNILPISAFLSPHDWGGWATLNVTANVGGQSVPGHIQNVCTGCNPNDANILLPQRQPASHIADNWKTIFGIPLSTSDLDDSENAPPNGYGQPPGDGLTLWEEYRGFYMGCSGNSAPARPEGTRGAKCQHVEGNPARKDLFVVNLTKLDAGIELFDSTSLLQVHFRGLRLDEIGRLGTSSYRVINFNHSAGAHEVDQHALVLDWGTEDLGFSQAVNIAGMPKRPGLPKEIDHIEITPVYESQNPNDEILSITVAHELAHSVSIWHHGDLDGPEYWDRDSNGNLTEQDVDPGTGTVFAFPKRVIYLMSEDEDPADLSNALTGENLNFLSLPRKVNVGNRICGLAPPFTSKMNGQHSGDEASYMRYHHAYAYIPQGFPQVRFFTAGEEVGMDLTDNPGGTGVNEPNRTIPLFPSGTRVKRVRYGDAFDQRGKDYSQIDVNDNNTAIVRPTQQLCP
jgi:hypothetical protein